MEKTILIKLSGEAMSGKNNGGLDFEYIEKICKMIKESHELDGTRVGNFAVEETLWGAEMQQKWIEKQQTMLVC